MISAYREQRAVAAVILSVMSALPLVLILLTTPVQAVPAVQDAAPQDEFEKLAAKLDDAHRKGVDREVPGFSAQLLLNTLAEDQDSLSIGLLVDFAAVPVGNRKRNLIKYRIQEDDGLIERGFGPLGYWTQIDDEVVFLTQAQHEQDKEAVLRDIRLAWQLLGYLDPGALLRKLSERSGVATEDLKISRRRKPIRCQVVSGLATSFPLYHLKGEVGAATIKVWVEEATGRLVAVEATPRDGRGQPIEEAREFIALFEHKDRAQDILLPGKLRIYTVDDEDTRQPQLEVVLQSIDLSPGFDQEHFKPTSGKPAPKKGTPAPKKPK